MSINCIISKSSLGRVCNPWEIALPTENWWTVNKVFNQFSTNPVHITSFSVSTFSFSREYMATILSYSFSWNSNCNQEKSKLCTNLIVKGRRYFDKLLLFLYCRRNRQDTSVWCDSLLLGQVFPATWGLIWSKILEICFVSFPNICTGK